MINMKRVIVAQYNKNLPWLVATLKTSNDNIVGNGRVLYILTSFWVLHAPKSWLKTFFQPFFCRFSAIFQHLTFISKIFQ